MDEKNTALEQIIPPVPNAVPAQSEQVPAVPEAENQIPATAPEEAAADGMPSTPEAVEGPIDGTAQEEVTDPQTLAAQAAEAELVLPPDQAPDAIAVPAAPDAPPAPALINVVDIHFRSGGKVYFFDPAGLELKAGMNVIIDTARGPEYGICASGIHPVPEQEVVTPLRQVVRIATENDERIARENREKEKRAFEVCLQKIADHKLEMQLVSAEYAFDGSKILFFFTADDRVDFRELVKNLASVFRTRIELRQIGVRDKAKMVGGLGICGRPFCCSSFLEEFQPVSIKMAKTQSLSLNPTKISGTCGRLMCCLKYEQDAYEDLLKTSPKLESLVDTPDGRGSVVEVNLLRQAVKVRLAKSPETISSYSNEDIYVLRSGKPKKTDVPIPDDFNPISSKPRPKKKEESFALDRVIFRYEQPEQSAAPAASPAEQEPRPARSRKPRQEAPKPRQDAPKPRQEAQKTWQDAPKPKQEAAEPQEPTSEEPAKQERRGPRQGKPNPGRGRREPRRQPNPPRQETAVPTQEAAGKPAPRQEAPKPANAQGDEKPRQENRQRRKPRPEKKPQQQAEAAPAAQPAEGGDGKSKKRRRYYHNNKPKGGAPA